MSGQASNRLLVEERRRADRRKNYGAQYLAMLIGVPEDRRQADRRNRPEPAAVPNADGSPAEPSHADENAAG